MPGHTGLSGEYARLSVHVVPSAFGVAFIGVLVDGIGYLPGFAIAATVLMSLGWMFAARLQHRPAIS